MIVFLGNPASTHLEHWVKIYRLAGEEGPISLASIHPIGDWQHGPILYQPTFLKTWQIFHVAVVALKLMTSIGVKDILHVHSVGRYGTAALLSRGKIIATIYGSEVSDSKRISLVGRLQALLFTKACLTHVTSDQMEAKISTTFKPNRLRIIHTGVEPIRRSLSDCRKNLVVLPRSVAPNYRTKEAISSLSNFLEANTSYSLLVICGHFDQNYLEECKATCVNMGIAQRVEFIQRFLSRDELFLKLQESAVSVSVPMRDQLGATVLESLACGTPVILSAHLYPELRDENGCHYISDFASLSDLVSSVVSRSLVETEPVLPSKFTIERAAELFKAELSHVKTSC